MLRLVISTVVIVMMCAIGLRTSASDFAVVWKRPGPLVLAIFINLLAVPLFAAAVLSMSDMPPAAIVGLLICAASPAGAVGPLLAMQGGGHVATAVTAMVVLSLLSVLSMPLTLSRVLGFSAAIDMSHLVLPMTEMLILVQLLPLVVGMAVRRFRPKWAERMARPANQLATYSMLAVIFGLLVTKWRVVIGFGFLGLALCIGLVLANLGFGAVVSNRDAERRSYAAVTGVRNLSLALLIGTAYFPDPTTSAAILSFGLFTMLIPFLAAKVVGASKAQQSDRNEPGAVL